jgi:hypothetical protein
MQNHYICSNVRQTSATEIFLDTVRYAAQISLQKVEIFAEGFNYICRARVGIRGQLLADQR